LAEGSIDSGPVAAREAPPFPPDTTLTADPSLRVRDQGRLLLGGAPLRIVRISESGARLVRSWLAGQPIGASPGSSALARRLVAAGMVHPHPPGGDRSTGPGHDLTVVVPVKDDPGGLAVTLSALSDRADLNVVVVDDGSDPPVTGPSAVARSAAAGQVRAVRRPVAGGPGVARQTALDAGVGTSLVAFVDAAVEVTADQLHHLARWFDDPAVVAVAPRITPGDDGGQMTDYEVDRSPLDLGPVGAPVGPGRMVSYLPSACLLARTAAVDAAGGFDPELRFGEDVDLVWRLVQQGDVRYDPSVVVRHPARATLAALLSQRFHYGRSAAPLAARHGDRLAPVRLSRWSLAVWALALTGHRVAAVALAGLTALLLRRKLAPVVPDPGAEAVRLVAAGHWWAGRQLADASVRAWWPAAAVAAVAAPTRRLVLPLVGWAWLRRLVDTPGRPRRRLSRLALTIADDGAYGAGVWAGAWRQRSIRCLLPALAEWPGRRHPAPATSHELRDGAG
jgi:mycofactocin system glycosyltransferase